MTVVVLSGPESAGKSSLCAALAAQWEAPVVGEYVREYIDGHRRDTCYADVTPIAREQWRREQAARARKPALLLLDTHLLSNHLWSLVLFGRSPAWLARQWPRARYDAIFLLEPEGLPWQGDGQRCQPALHARQAFHGQLRQALQQQGHPWTAVGGSWQERYAQIDAALQRMLTKK